jgi:hypothetical protein
MHFHDAPHRNWPDLAEGRLVQARQINGEPGHDAS